MTLGLHKKISVRKFRSEMTYLGFTFKIFQQRKERIGEVVVGNFDS